MQTPFVFPFGQPVMTVQQTDRSPKRVFVLGVYASAVHARWVDAAGKQLVRALAVASEPYIFWRGDEAEAILKRIAIPPAAGRLFPADRRFNGPSGIALDELFLGPLGLSRTDVWLSDLVPHSCLNNQQAEALEREYTPLRAALGLPDVSLPTVPKVLADDQRQSQIAEELKESGAEILILLGDQPIRWFLRAFDQRWRNLGAFGRTPDSYGRLHAVEIRGKRIRVLPLVHTRQAARLGHSSVDWGTLHHHWVQHVAGVMVI